MPSNHLILCHPFSCSFNLFQHQGFVQWVSSFSEILGWVPIQADWCPYEKRRLGHRCTEGWPCEDTVKRWPSTHPGERPRKETNSVHILVLDFQPPELWDNKIIFTGPPSPCYFVMLTLATSHEHLHSKDMIYTGSSMNKCYKCPHIHQAMFTSKEVKKQCFIFRAF